MAVALLDSNVLVHASYRGSLHYANAARLLALGLGKSGRFCIAPQNLVEFAAVVTRKRFVDPPMTAADVLRISDLLYRSRRLSKIYPQRGTVLRTMREGHALSIQGPRWYDLFLAVTMRDAALKVIITENVNDFSSIPFITALTIERAVKEYGA